MPEAPIYTACGKQVLRDGQHFADLCGPAEAAAIADVLNGQWIIQAIEGDYEHAARVEEIVGVLWP